MTLYNSFLSWIMRKRMHQIELFIKYPYDVQKDWFKKLISSGIKTEWGQKYGYSSIKTYEDYKNNVPVSQYDDLIPYIDRLMQGEQKLLWNTNIKWMAKSSGTTASKSKFIPVSKESLEECHFKGGKDLFAIYCHNYPETNLFNGKALAMGGSHQICEFNNQSYYGDLSAILIQNLPFWAEFQRTPSLDIALMDNWEEKIEKMALAILKDDITNISGVPSWTLLLLKKVLDITGKENIFEVWPELELYVHGGVSFIPYRHEFKTLFPGNTLNYVETYNASEGFFGIQDTPDRDDLLLMLDYGIFYEFISLSALNDPYPLAVSIEDVETDVNYAIVITTNSGLWRYMIGDTVKFTSKNPYRLKITGRTKSYINAFGEELIIENAENALKIACEKANANIREYTAAPVYLSGKASASHEWVIEFSKAPDSLGYFTEILDNALKSLNSDYEAKRYHDILLKMPLIHGVKEGTFYNWMKKRGKLGGQNKVPRLSNDRTYIDEILDIVNTNL